jgi:hypothetical protein
MKWEIEHGWRINKKLQRSVHGVFVGTNNIQLENLMETDSSQNNLPRTSNGYCLNISLQREAVRGFLYLGTCSEIKPNFRGNDEASNHMTYGTTISYSKIIFGNITIIQNRKNLDEEVETYFDVVKLTISKQC